ncbi:MAG: class I SAM-dependent methyltransferase [Thermoprotei archaeon]
MMKDAPKPSIEVGVGPGFFALAANIDTGLDPSINMLKLAKDRGIDNLILGVGEHMPLRDSTFGSTLIVVTLCFVDDPLTALKESYRVLRRGGYIVTCIIPRDSPWGKYYSDLGVKGHRFYSRAKFYTINEVIEMLEISGFKILDFGGTLSTSPNEAPRVEEPSTDINGKNFICIKAIK